MTQIHSRKRRLLAVILKLAVVVAVCAAVQGTVRDALAGPPAFVPGRMGAHSTDSRKIDREALVQRAGELRKQNGI